MFKKRNSKATERKRKKREEGQGNRGTMKEESRTERGRKI